MKKLILVLSLTLFTITAQCADWANFSRYASANNNIKDSPKIVLMGDSITDGWANSRGDFFTKNNFAGRGISGQVTSQMLVRIRADVIDLKPKAVAILAGINDIAKNQGDISVEHIFGNICSMAEICKAHGIKVIISSTLPANKIPWNTEVEFVAEKVKKLNALLKDYAQKNGFEYLDYCAALANAEYALTPDLARDGIHPTAKGYEIMEKLLLKKAEDMKL